MCVRSMAGVDDRLEERRKEGEVSMNGSVCVGGGVKALADGHEVRAWKSERKGKGGHGNYGWVFMVACGNTGRRPGCRRAVMGSNSRGIWRQKGGGSRGRCAWVECLDQ